jgi:hypothetical protein
MAKTITVPADRGNPVVVQVNGKKYQYTAGATVSVPDEVASLLGNNSQQDVEYGRVPTAPLTPTKRNEDGSGIPVSVSDTGEMFADGEAAADTVLSKLTVNGHTLTKATKQEA